MEPMLIALLAVSIFALIGWGIAVFLGKEMLKKFSFLSKFAAAAPGNLVTMDFPSSNKSGYKPGMRKIILRGSEPFSVLVGFHLAVPGFGAGFDYYGYVKAVAKGPHHEAVISTFLGKGAVKFQFLCSIPGVTASSSDEDQKMSPVDATYAPHWWQKLGFFS